MPSPIALSENVTSFPWALNYICFMHIVVQLIVPKYGLTLIRALIKKLKLPTIICVDGIWDIAECE